MTADVLSLDVEGNVEQKFDVLTTKAERLDDASVKLEKGFKGTSDAAQALGTRISDVAQRSEAALSRLASSNRTMSVFERDVRNTATLPIPTTQSVVRPAANNDLRALREGIASFTREAEKAKTVVDTLTTSQPLSSADRDIQAMRARFAAFNEQVARADELIKGIKGTAADTGEGNNGLRALVDDAGNVVAPAKNAGNELRRLQVAVRRLSFITSQSRLGFFAAELLEIAGVAEQAGGRVGNLGTRFAAFATSARGLLTLGGSLAAFLAIRGLARTERELDKYRQQLVGITGDGNKASEVLDRLRQVAGPVFKSDVDDTVTALIDLRRRGLSTSFEAFESMSNIVKVTGKNINDVAKDVVNFTTGNLKALENIGVQAVEKNGQILATFDGQTSVLRNSRRALQDYVTQLGAVNFDPSTKSAITFSSALARLGRSGSDLTRLVASPLQSLFRTISVSVLNTAAAGLERVADGIRFVSNAVTGFVTSGGWATMFRPLGDFVSSAVALLRQAGIAVVAFFNDVFTAVGGVVDSAITRLSETASNSGLGRILSGIEDSGFVTRIQELFNFKGRGDPDLLDNETIARLRNILDTSSVLPRAINEITTSVANSTDATGKAKEEWDELNKLLLQFSGGTTQAVKTSARDLSRDLSRAARSLARSFENPVERFKRQTEEALQAAREFPDVLSGARLSQGLERIADSTLSSLTRELSEAPRSVQQAWNSMLASVRKETRETFRQLRESLSEGAITQSEFMNLIEQAQRGALERISDTYRSVQDLQGRLNADMSRVVDNLTNRMDGFFKSVRDGLVDGKLDFADFGKFALDVLDEIVRHSLRQQNAGLGRGGFGGLFDAAAGIFGSLFGGGSQSTSNALLQALNAGGVRRAHEGEYFVPREQLYLLSPGERVLDPAEAADSRRGGVQTTMPMAFTFSVTNTGSPKEVDENQSTFDPKTGVFEMFLADMNSGGQYHAALEQKYNLSRL